MDKEPGFQTYMMSSCMRN